MPPTSNPGAVFVFNQQVKQFEQAYANEKIVTIPRPTSPGWPPASKRTACRATSPSRRS
jgi:hypothetical protein